MQFTKNQAIWLYTRGGRNFSDIVISNGEYGVIMGRKFVPLPSDEYLRTWKWGTQISLMKLDKFKLNTGIIE